MFTWICPQCGREVPPAYDECPDCKERAAQQAQPQPGAPMPPPPPAPPASPQAHVQPQFQPPAHQPQGPYQPPSAPPPQISPAPQVFVRPYTPAPPPPSSGLPVWLLTILFALATLGVVAGVVWTVGYFRNRPETKPSTAVESPAARPGAPANALQRYIEISGVRFTEDARHKGKPVVRFIITNHSDAEIMGLAGNVTIWGATRKSEEDAQGTFTLKADLKPMESREMEAPLTTKLKIYELPDWQNVTTDVQITAPAASAR